MIPIVNRRGVCNTGLPRASCLCVVSLPPSWLSCFFVGCLTLLVTCLALGVFFGFLLVFFRSLNFMPTMTNHIFIPCCWLVVLHMNLSALRTRNHKFLWRQSSCHPNQFSICLISRVENEHIIFMTIHCYTKRRHAQCRVEAPITNHLRDSMQYVKKHTMVHFVFNFFFGV